MYGLLSWDAQRVGMLMKTLVWQRTPVELWDEERKARLQHAADLVKKKAAPAQQVSAALDLALVALRVPEESQLDFAMHLCLAHHALPPEHLKARTDAIQHAIDSQFTEFKARPDVLSKEIRALSAMATLLPDSLLDIEVKLNCTAIRMHLLGLPKIPPEYAHRQELARQIAAYQGAKDASVEFLKSVLGLAAAERPPAEFDAFADHVRKALSDPQHTYYASHVFNTAIKSAHALENLPPNRAQLIAAQMFKEAMEGKEQMPQYWKEVAERRAADEKATFDRALNLQYRATLAAVEAGVDMGKDTPAFQAAVEQMKQASAAIDRNMTARLRKAQATDKQSTSAVETSGDEDPVWSWSIDKLAQWIDGPVVSKPKSVIDRHQIVARSHEKAPAHHPAPITVSQPKTEDAPLTDADVDAVIRDGLSACVQFFLADIVDMLRMAKELKGAIDLVQALVQTETHLRKLRFDAKSFDELATRNVLTDAETEIERLRGSLHKAKASAKVQSTFSTQLGAALRNEPLVLGKRHGAAINCPVRFEDWDYVSSTFHNRWLPDIRGIVVGDAPMPLGPDQALALYVTGSSQSGYAFDVSVHLWRRRPGVAHPPSRENVPYPPMDKEFWFDTYATCGVLHVPLAH